MITLSIEDMQRIIYNGMVVAVTQHQTRPVGYVCNSEFLLGLHEQAGKMACNVQSSPNYPIDLERVAAVL